VIAKRCAAFILFVPATVVSGCDGRPAADSAPSNRVATPPPPAPVEDLPGTTPGGTRLRFGKKAIITVGPAGDLSRVGVIINDVEQGTPEDQAALRAQLPDQTGSGTGLFFIRGIIINEDGMDGVGSYSGPLLYGVTKDGEDTGVVMLMGPSAAIWLPNCVMTSTPPGEWAARGARHQICRIALSSRAVTGVRLANAGGGGSVYWR
jgi:hypothetical protein